MSEIKKLLKINSFSEIVGMSQPKETCPMIDNHILSLNQFIESATEELNCLENQLSECDEEFSLTEKNALESKILSIESEIREKKDKIDQLENDRQLITRARSYSASCRANILSLIQDALVVHLGAYFLCTKKLNEHKPSIHPYSSEYLQTDYSDIEKHYQKIIDWGIAWDEAMPLLVDAFDGRCDICNLDKQELENFLKLSKRIENHIVMNELLTKNETHELFNLFDSIHYEGIAYRSIYLIGADNIEWSDHFENICWSKNKNAINKVIDSQHHQPDIIKIYKAKVVGLDLSKLLEQFSQLFSNLDYGEDEILAIDYDELEFVE